MKRDSATTVGWKGALANTKYEAGTNHRNVRHGFELESRRGVRDDRSSIRSETDAK